MLMPRATDADADEQQRTGERHGHRQQDDHRIAKLLNRAASARKITISAKAKVVTKPPLSCTYCREAPPKSSV